MVELCVITILLSSGLDDIKGCVVCFVRSASSKGKWNEYVGEMLMIKDSYPNLDDSGPEN